MLDEYASLMTIIQISVDIKAPVEKIWEIISDLDNEPKFWKGTKEVRNISKEGNPSSVTHRGLSK